MSYLIEGERKLLAALADEGWRNSVELEDLTGLAGFQVRSMLSSLRRLRLVRRGCTLETVGKHTITEAGLRLVAEHRQLRLVR